MKKLITLVLTAVMMVSGMIAAAEGIDFSALSAEELQNIITQARFELTKYHPLAADGSILYEDENVRVTYTGAIVLDEMFDQMEIKVIVENLSEKNLNVALDNVSCNGWSIWEASVEVPAGKKAKESFFFMNAMTDAELAEAEDVKDIEADLYYYDSDTWDNVIDPVHVIWLFNE